MADAGVLISLGTALVLLGFVIIALALFLACFRRGEGISVSGGGAVIIGFIPIVFGTDKKALRMVLSLSIMLTLLLLVVMVVNYVLR